MSNNATIFAADAMPAAYLAVPVAAAVKPAMVPNRDRHLSGTATTEITVGQDRRPRKTPL